MFWELAECVNFVWLVVQVEGELGSSFPPSSFFPLVPVERAKTNTDQFSILPSFLALVGTLRSAKRQKIVKYDSEMLLQGMSDDIDIVLLV